MEIILYRTGDYFSLREAAQSGGVYKIHCNSNVNMDLVEHIIYQTASMFGYSPSEYNINQQLEDSK
jgi:hypothetical protein